MPKFRWSRLDNAAQASIGIFMVFRGVHAPFKNPLIICISNHLPRSSIYQEKVVFLYRKYKTMVIEYDKNYLRELYEDGKCKDKKHRFDASVVKKYQKRIDILIGATRIEDLFVFNSLDFEVLSGKDSFSIRIDYHYRLEFKIRKEGSETVLTICTVLDITNHYQ
ncbi:type II toxin-antitoxin system RelE/ParE family toxin [Bacteroides sp.]|uniref:type II toxin-antitoxin system RelE/ParE family toxin n=1 Tax=Bacteroides sp. TaxID=29523 RepID=UPI0025C2C275|nr:type II toxin-antitoxin system RelE/ParE family toxin [Bacteroides sp.]